MGPRLASIARVKRRGSIGRLEAGALGLGRIAPLALAGVMLATASAGAVPPLPAITQLMHEEWQTDRGLPQNSIHCLAQDALGFLWFGTEAGLARFDGVQFEVFTTLTHPEIPNNFCSALLAARDGSLWCGSRAGGLFRWRAGRFEAPPADWREVEVLSLAESPNGTLWIGTRFGLQRLDPAAGTQLESVAGVSELAVSALHAAADGSVWIGGRQGELARLAEGRLRWLSRDHLRYPSAVRGIVEDPADGAILVGYDGDGLFRLRGGQFEHLPLEAGKPSLAVESLCLSRDGAVWLATQRDGLLRYARGEVSRFSVEQGLGSDLATCVLQDREGSMWAGTLFGGLHRFHEGAVTTLTARDGLPTDGITCLVAEDTESLWVGTSGSGLFRAARGFFSPVPLGTGERQWIQSLLRSANGDLWIGTHDGGLGQRTAEGSARFWRKEEGLPSSDITALFERRSGELWIGTASSGLAVRDPKTSAFRAIKEPEFLRVHIRCFAEAADGTLWIGTQRSLIRHAEGQFTRHAEGEGLGNLSVRSLLLESNQVLWIGSRDNGLLRLDLAGGAPVRIDPAAGLKHSRIFHILRHGPDLWLAGNRGIERLAVAEAEAFASGARAQVASTLYSERDGLRTGECTDSSNPSALAAADGRLWFATRRGLAAVHPAAMPSNSIPPNVLITGVGIDDRKVAPAEAARIPPGATRLEFNYTALSLRTPQRVAFRCKLEGLDKDWIDPGPQREAVYYNLRPGRYAFHVRAANDAGVWNDAGATLAFAVAPFFYQTAWFQAGAALAALAALGGVLRWRTREANQRARELQEEVARRTGELREEVGQRAAAERELLSLNSQLESRVQERTGELREAFHKLSAELREREAAEEKIRNLNQSLEARVRERTRELSEINAQLSSEVQERKRGAVALGVFSRLGQRLHSARTESEAASIVAQEAKVLIPHDECLIQLYDPESRLYPVIQSGAAGAGIRSRASVPIRNGSRTVGIIELGSSAPGSFALHDTNTLQALADYCGGALDHIHAEQARRETERRFSTFMTHAPALAWMKDRDFRYVFSNQMFQTFAGRTEAQIEGRTDQELWGAETALAMRENDQRALESQSMLETQETIAGPDGGTRTLLALRFLFTTASGAQFVAGMGIDITRQKRAEEALHRLPQSILEAQEAERRRVARELHDGVTQAIAAAKFRIHTAEQQILRGDAKWRDTCNQSKGMLDAVLQQVRRLSRNLRPGELDDLGLIPAARAACAEFSARTGIEIAFHHLGFDGADERGSRLPPALELSLYRIIQEALNNIEKHSAAAAASISLERSAAAAELEIADDGRGFELSAQPGGLGLLHMRERAGLMDGQLQLETAPGQGVRIKITVPIRAS